MFGNALTLNAVVNYRECKEKSIWVGFAGGSGREVS